MSALNGSAASREAISGGSASTSSCSTLKPCPPSKEYEETSSAEEAAPMIACVRGGSDVHGGEIPALTFEAPEASWTSTRTRIPIVSLGLAAKTSAEPTPSTSAIVGGVAAAAAVSGGTRTDTNRVPTPSVEAPCPAEALAPAEATAACNALVSRCKPSSNGSRSSRGRSGCALKRLRR